jgi:hypothetical protein
MTYRILQGDCIDRLRELPADSIDAVVTDPPAGINFMNREWDHHKGGMNPWVEWMTEVMREALRVCKPGAHALVWALPRTSHWTGSALELAGWQVRDVVTHMFGSGFPKSHNLDGGLGTALKPAAEFWWLARKPLGMTVEACVAAYGTGALNIDACRIGTGDTLSFGSRAIGDGVKYGEQRPENQTPGEQNPSGRWPANVVLGHSEGCVPTGTRRVKPKGATAHRREHGDGGIFLPNRDKHDHAGYRDADGLETVTAWECEPGCPVRALDEQTDGVVHGAGRARDASEGTHSGDQGVVGFTHGAPAMRFGDSGGTSRFFAQFNHTEEPGRFRYVAKASSAERSAGLDSKITACRCHEANTGPSQQRATDELDGTGDTSSSTSGSGSKPTDRSPTATRSTTSTGTSRTTTSRTSPSSPPPSTSGSTAPTTAAPATGGSDAATFAANGSHPTSSTTTSAARDGLSTDAADRATSHESSQPSSSAGTTCADCGGVIGVDVLRNVHPLGPTVKPVELMRWLIRLVTPPGGTVLDPFLGSGSTGCAAVLERVEFIGIERDPEYVRISEARIKWWSEHPDGMQLVKRLEREAERKAVAESGQVSMFDLLGDA